MEMLSEVSDLPNGEKSNEVKVLDPLGDTPLLISVLQNSAKAQGKSVTFLAADDISELLGS